MISFLKDVLEKRRLKKLYSKTSGLLRHLGYDITDEGVFIIHCDSCSGYSPAETAFFIAITTLAQDIHSHFYDPIKLMGMTAHGIEIARTLKMYKERHLVSPIRWQHDSNVIKKICFLNEDQEEWIKKVVSDPIAANKRLANSRIAY